MRAPYRVYASDDVHKNAKVKFTPDGFCKVTCFTRAVYKQAGFEELEMYGYDIAMKSPKKETKKTESSQGVRADNFKRAKDKIFDIASANKWDYMVTFTLDADKIDRFDKATIKAIFGKWLDNMVQRRGFKALIIPEYHKDGAIHFHGLINDSLKMSHSGTYKIKGKKKPVGLSSLKRQGLTPDDDKVQDVYNVTDYKLGFSTAVRLDDNSTAVAFYMTKYCTKELDKIFGSFYFAVGKIERELPFIVCNMDFNELLKVGNSRAVKLPENLGEVVYATITADDFYGGEIL
jgi:hypothetical protein